MSESKVTNSAQPKEFKIGGGWGDSIVWTRPEQFNAGLSTDNLYSVHGWKNERPQVGDLLIAEFQRSWMVFEFVEVELCRDPQDMFFAKVRPIKQTMKS